MHETNNFRTEGRARIVYNNNLPDLNDWLQSNTNARIAAVAIFGVSILLGIFALDSRLNIDAAWGMHRLTVEFWETLQNQKSWRSVFIVHPGITVMWLSGGSMKLFGVMGRTITEASLIAAKLPIVVIASATSGLTFLWVRRLLGTHKSLTALCCAVLLMTEPFVIGHSRSFYLDSMVTSVGWLAVLATLIAVKASSGRWSIIAGVLFSLAFLTKISAAALAFGGILVLPLVVTNGIRLTRQLVRCIAVLILAGVVTTLALWPALLTDFTWTATQLIERSLSTVEVGHEVFFWGKTYSSDPGIRYYFAVLLFRATPEMLCLFATGVLMLVQEKHARKFPLYIALFYLPLAVILLDSPKKIDRYVLTLYPLLCLFAGFASAELYTRLKRWQKSPLIRHAAAMLLLTVVFFRIARVAAAYPLPVGWCSKIPGLKAHEAITVGWGEGLKEMAAWIRRDSRSNRPTVHMSFYHKCMKPWLNYRRVRPSQAEYIVKYLSTWQRRHYHTQTLRYIAGKRPLFDVRVDGRRYAWVFAGPKYRGLSENPR